MKTSWIVFLIAGLALEICVLAIGVSLWMGWLGLAPILGQRGPTPVANLPGTQASPLPPAETARPSDTPPPTGTLTATPMPSPTVSPTPADRPVWNEAPPSGKIVFACFDGSFDQICIMNADGSERRQLTDTKAGNFYPSLSADGSTIVFSSRRTGNWEIFSMDTAGGHVTQLTEDLGSLYAPELSPKGDRIVFTNARGGMQSTWVMKINGDNPHSLNEDEGGGIDPTWSPDGMEIAFASDREGGGAQLFIMDASGNHQRRVIKNAPKIGGRSSWSPDGQWLVYYAGPTGKHEIYLVSVDGKQLLQLTNGGDNLGPSFSPDGKWIVFTSFRDGKNQLYVMHPDGTGVTRLSFGPISDWQPRWGP